MYTAAQHAIHVQQHEDWVRALYNLKEEAVRLRLVRQHSINNGVNGALSEEDADYIATDKYSVAEIEGASTLMNQVIGFLEGTSAVSGNKVPSMTPFLQESA